MGDAGGVACSGGSCESRHACESAWARFRFSDLQGGESTCVFTGATRPGKENVMIDKKHNKEDLPVMTGQAKTADPELMRNAAGTAGPASALSRRKFLEGVSVSAAAVATAVGVPASFAKQTIELGGAAQSEALRQASDKNDNMPRTERAFQSRV